MNHSVNTGSQTDGKRPLMINNRDSKPVNIDVTPYESGIYVRA